MPLKLFTFLANKDEEKEKEKVEEKVLAVESCLRLKLELQILYIFRLGKYLVFDTCFLSGVRGCK